MSASPVLIDLTGGGIQPGQVKGRVMKRRRRAASSEIIVLDESGMEEDDTEKEGEEEENKAVATTSSSSSSSSSSHLKDSAAAAPASTSSSSSSSSSSSAAMQHLHQHQQLVDLCCSQTQTQSLFQSQSQFQFLNTTEDDGLTLVGTTVPHGGAPRRDWRALMESGTEEDRLTYGLLLEEEQKRERALAAMKYKCAICLDDEVDLDQMVTLSCAPVGHRFCKDCFEGYCSSKINEANVSDKELVCPAPKCGTPVTIHELEGNLSADMLARYTKFTLKSMAETGDEYRTCPKCNEWFVEVELKPEYQALWAGISCGKPGCGHLFCGDCGQDPHHGGMNDMTCEEAAAYKKARECNSKEDLDFEEFVRTSKEHQVCPGCKTAAELTAGNCKFCYCKCGCRFCFLCGVRLAEADHYRHFTAPGLGGPFGSTCKGLADPMAGKPAAGGAAGGVGAARAAMRAYAPPRPRKKVPKPKAKKGGKK